MNWLVDAIVRTVRTHLSPLFYRGVFEYRVAIVLEGIGPPAITLMPVNEKWLPPVTFAEIWPGAAGHSATPKLGSTVAVGFLDANAARPFIVGFCPVSTPLDFGVPTKASYTADDIVEIGNGTEMVGVGGGTGRPACFGDWIMVPVGQPPVLTAVQIIGSLPGATVTPTGPFPVARVQAQP